MPDEWKKRNARVGNLTQGPFVQHSIAAGPGSVFSEALDRYCGGERDAATLGRLKSRAGAS